VQDKELDRKILACTQVIERGEGESRENRAVAYSNRGIAYVRKGAFDRAIADSTKAIALDPKLVQARYNRGIAYRKKGDKEQAIADFRKALEIDPSDQDAKNSLKQLGVTP
jgi:tetratricopeptide (TPR) repeat protein